MARKKEPVVPPKAPGADDLQVLHPDLTTRIQGIEVTVREYGFVEGLRLRPRIQPFLDDLFAVVAGDRLPSLDEVKVLLGTHTDAMIEALAVSADVEVSWLATLSQSDGENLLNLWWIANGPFVMRSVLDRIRAEGALEKLRAGQMSTQPSSPAGTEPQSQSGG